MDTLSVRDAGTYLNAPRVQPDMLYRSGILVPRIKATGHGPPTRSPPRTWYRPQTPA